MPESRRRCGEWGHLTSLAVSLDFPRHEKDDLLNLGNSHIGRNGPSRRTSDVPDSCLVRLNSMFQGAASLFIVRLACDVLGVVWASV